MMEAIAILTTGATFTRSYGFQKLRIDGADLSRADAGMVPLLDTHSLKNPPLGHLVRAWIDDKNNCVKAKLAFDDTRAGRFAFERVALGELCGVSPGVTATEFEIFDANGDPVDAVEEFDRHTETDRLFVATRWQLLEVSLCAVPGDPGALARAYISDAHRIRMRMESLHRRMLAEPARPMRGGTFDIGEKFDEGGRPLRGDGPLDDDDDTTWRRVIMPDRRLLQYRPPGV